MKRIIVSGLTLMFPLAAAAATVADIIGRARSVVNLVIPLLASVAFAASLYGIMRFIASSGNEEKRSEAKKYVLYGLIGMFVIIAFWGILTVVANTFFKGSLGSPISISGIVPPFNPNNSHDTNNANNSDNPDISHISHNSCNSFNTDNSHNPKSYSLRSRHLFFFGKTMRPLVRQLRQ